MELLLELIVGGVKYRIFKMNGKNQTALFLRVTPFLLPTLISVLKGEKPNMIMLVGYLLTELAKMSDEEVDYIANKSLAVVMRESEPGKYAPLINAAGGEMFQDISGPDRLELIANSLHENVLKHAKAFTDALKRLALDGLERATDVTT